MCLVLWAYYRHPRYQLVLAANRDEFYARPSAPAHRWPEAPDVLAGRDLEAGGTWLGVSERGRLALVTNYREPNRRAVGRRSRGWLTRDFLLENEPPAAYLERVLSEGNAYNGFNLLVGDTETLAYGSNRSDSIRVLAPGLYGLSNHLLGTRWPKVTRGLVAFEAILQHDSIDPEALLALLADRTPRRMKRCRGQGWTWNGSVGFPPSLSRLLSTARVVRPYCSGTKTERSRLLNAPTGRAAVRSKPASTG